MRILLVATDTERMAALKPLVGWGHRVWVCGGEADARAQLEKEAADLILADGALPAWASGLAGSLSPVPLCAVIGAPSSGAVYALPSPPGENDLRRFVQELAPRVEPPPFNRAAALRICDDDDELLRDIVEVFMGDAPVQLEKMRKGFAENDLEQVRRAAHSIKGASSNIAAEPLREAAQQLEWSGKRQVRAAAHAHFAEVQYQFLRLKKYLSGAGLGPQ